jgi:energy-coupling factor transporter ATP-binding protein EcfA2
MPTVRLDKVSLSFGLKPLLDAADLQIRRGERVCLLGRNGEGKSSLLQLITRQIAPDSGEVWVRPGARVASLAQEVSPASEASVRPTPARVRPAPLPPARLRLARRRTTIGRPNCRRIKSYRACNSIGTPRWVRCRGAGGGG